MHFIILFLLSEVEHFNTVGSSVFYLGLNRPVDHLLGMNDYYKH